MMAATGMATVGCCIWSDDLLSTSAVALLSTYLSGGLFETDIFNNLLDLVVRDAKDFKVIEGYPFRERELLAAAAGAAHNKRQR